MNIDAATSTAVSSAQSGSAAGFKVARLALDEAQRQGDAANALIKSVADAARSSASPARDPRGVLGNAIDTFA